MAELTIPDMTCGHCKAVVEKTIKDVAPGASVTVDLPAQKVTTDAADIGAVLKALDAEGYPATVA